MESWNKAFARAAKDLIDACKLPQRNRARKESIARALKWYGALPQLIFRSPGRSPARNAYAIKLRLHQFLNSDFKKLLTYWHQDFSKVLSRKRKPVSDSFPTRVKRAEGLISSGRISRGIRLIEGYGRSDPDDPHVKDQMLRKHPKPEATPVWSPLPVDWYQNADFDLDAIDDLVKNIDPHTGVSTRGFRTDYARSLFITRSQDNEANSVPKLFKDLGILFFQGTVPPWARSCLLSGLLTPLNKKEVIAGEVS
jgi:hypothetical protein